MAKARSKSSSKKTKQTRANRNIGSRTPRSKSPVIETNSGVKIYSPKGNNKYYRITWIEDGRSRDTTATDQAKAILKASEIDNKLQSGSGDQPYKTCSELITKYLEVKTDRENGEWGQKHTLNQTHLLTTYVIPEIGSIQCIKLQNEDLKKIIRKADTYSKSEHLISCLSALVHWGSAEGWITSKTDRLLKDLKKIKKNKRPKIAGENRLYVDQSLIPTHDAVHSVAKASSEITGIWWYELMFNLAAYSGCRLGELIDLDTESVVLNKQKIIVSNQCLDVGGRLTRTAPKWNTVRETTFIKVTPSGYQLQKNLKKRIKELEDLEDIPKVQDGTNRLLLFPNSQGGWMNPSVFSHRVRRPAQDLAKWPKVQNKFIWNFHSLRHVFCSYYFAELRKDIRDVATAAGHKNPATTMEMYDSNVEGTIERLRA